MSKVLGGKATISIGGEIVGKSTGYEINKTNDKLEVSNMGMITMEADVKVKVLAPPANKVADEFRRLFESGMMVHNPRKSVIINNLEKLPGIEKVEIIDKASGKVEVTMKPTKPIEFIEIKIDIDELKVAAGHKKWDSIMEELESL